MVDTPQNPIETPAPPEGAAPHDHEHDHAHGHEHDHPHEDAPALNPECTRQVQVEVSAEEVGSVYQSTIKRYRKIARIPGFRAGKVPESVVRTKFAAELRQDVLEALLPAHLRKALDAQGLQPVSQPQVTDLQLVEGESLRFRAVFEVMPALDVTGHQEVKVERPDVTLTEEEFQAEMARLRDAHATMETVAEERPLADGDFAVIRYHGQVQGATEDAPKQPIEGEDATIEVNGANTLEAFTAALRGATVGQQLQVEAVYPEGSHDARLAGKSVAYDVEVKAIQKKVLPELDDDFAKQMGEYETLAAFEEKLREQMASEKRRRLEGATKDKLIAALVERFPFPVPESLVQQQVDARLDRGLRALAAQGMTPDMLRQLDFPRLRAAQRDAALAEVKGALLLDHIAGLEHVELTDDEVETQLQLLSYQMREPLESLRKRLTEDGGLARIREQILRDKTVHLLYERMPA
jgi:trigger factor